MDSLEKLSSADLFTNLTIRIEKKISKRETRWNKLFSKYKDMTDESGDLEPSSEALYHPRVCPHRSDSTYGEGLSPNKAMWVQSWVNNLAPALFGEESDGEASTSDINTARSEDFVSSYALRRNEDLPSRVGVKVRGPVQSRRPSSDTSENSVVQVEGSDSSCDIAEDRSISFELLEGSHSNPIVLRGHKGSHKARNAATPTPPTVSGPKSGTVTQVAVPPLGKAAATQDVDVVISDEEPPTKSVRPTAHKGAKVKRHFLDEFNVDYFQRLGMEWKPDVNALRKEVEESNKANKSANQCITGGLCNETESCTVVESQCDSDEGEELRFRSLLRRDRKLVKKSKVILGSTEEAFGIPGKLVKLVDSEPSPRSLLRSRPTPSNSVVNIDWDTKLPSTENLTQKATFGLNKKVMKRVISSSLGDKTVGNSAVKSHRKVRAAEVSDWSSVSPSQSMSRSKFSDSTTNLVTEPVSNHTWTKLEEQIFDCESHNKRTTSQARTRSKHLVPIQPFITCPDKPSRSAATRSPSKNYPRAGTVASATGLTLGSTSPAGLHSRRYTAAREVEHASLPVDLQGGDEIPYPLFLQTPMVIIDKLEVEHFLRRSGGLRISPVEVQEYSHEEQMAEAMTRNEGGVSNSPGSDGNVDEISVLQMLLPSTSPRNISRGDVLNKMSPQRDKPGVVWYPPFQTRSWIQSTPGVGVVSSEMGKSRLAVSHDLVSSSTDELRGQCAKLTRVAPEHLTSPFASKTRSSGNSSKRKATTSVSLPATCLKRTMDVEVVEVTPEFLESTGDQKVSSSFPQHLHANTMNSIQTRSSSIVFESFQEATQPGLRTTPADCEVNKRMEENLKKGESFVLPVPKKQQRIKENSLQGELCVADQAKKIKFTKDVNSKSKTLNVTKNKNEAKRTCADVSDEYFIQVNSSSSSNLSVEESRTKRLHKCRESRKNLPINRAGPSATRGPVSNKRLLSASSVVTQHTSCTSNKVKRKSMPAVAHGNSNLSNNCKITAEIEEDTDSHSSTKEPAMLRKLRWGYYMDGKSSTRKSRESSDVLVLDNDSDVSLCSDFDVVGGYLTHPPLPTGSGKKRNKQSLTSSKSTVETRRKLTNDTATVAGVSTLRNKNASVNLEYVEMTSSSSGSIIVQDSAGKRSQKSVTELSIPSARSTRRKKSAQGLVTSPSKPNKRASVHSVDRDSDVESCVVSRDKVKSSQVVRKDPKRQQYNKAMLTAIKKFENRNISTGNHSSEQRCVESEEKSVRKKSLKIIYSPEQYFIESDSSLIAVEKTKKNAQKTKSLQPYEVESGSEEEVITVNVKTKSRSRKVTVDDIRQSKSSVLRFSSSQESSDGCLYGDNCRRANKVAQSITQVHKPTVENQFVAGNRNSARQTSKDVDRSVVQCKSKKEKPVVHVVDNVATGGAKNTCIFGKRTREQPKKNWKKSISILNDETSSPPGKEKSLGEDLTFVNYSTLFKDPKEHQRRTELHSAFHVDIALLETDTWYKQITRGLINKSVSQCKASSRRRPEKSSTSHRVNTLGETSNSAVVRPGSWSPKNLGADATSNSVLTIVSSDSDSQDCL